MKQFVFKIIFFIIIWMGITILVDIKITHDIRNSQVREYRIWEDIFNNRITADIIVLGSSRTYNHYNTKVI